MITFILSTILHHANKAGRTPAFYDVKKKLLMEYGKSIGYSVQKIPSKSCFTCNGTGTYWNSYGWSDSAEECWDCDGTGLYKLEKVTTLECIEFGKFRFFVPSDKINHLPLLSEFEGYVEHTPSKYGQFAFEFLMCIYSPGYFQLYMRIKLQRLKYLSKNKILRLFCGNLEKLNYFLYFKFRQTKKHFEANEKIDIDIDYESDDLPF